MLSSFFTFFLIISTKDQESFYLHSLMWIAEMTADSTFDANWRAATDKKELRELLIQKWIDREV